MKLRNVTEIQNLKDVRVLVRLDLNVPIQNGIIMDDFRIRRALPLVRYLLDKGAQLILASHIESKEKVSLKPVADYIKNTGTPCVFEKDYKKVRDSKHPVVLLENLREHAGEKENDRGFAKELASLGDVYVNEAFSVSHRCHASVCAITEFIPSYAGFQFEDEVKHLTSAFNPEHPFLFILGGAKFDTKLPLLNKFVTIADKVFVGGALAHDFFAAQGRNIGASLVSDTPPDLTGLLGNEKILLPIDDVMKDTAIMDAGMKTVELLRVHIERAKYILWNGPLGAYEGGYKSATLQLAQMLADATKHGKKTIVGGGDTLATIAELKLEDSFTFVSTGGGAMLDFLAKGTLPAIQALLRGME